MSHELTQTRVSTQIIIPKICNIKTDVCDLSLKNNDTDQYIYASFQ